MVVVQLRAIGLLVILQRAGMLPAPADPSSEEHRVSPQRRFSLICGPLPMSAIRLPVLVLRLFLPAVCLPLLGFCLPGPVSVTTAAASELETVSSGYLGGIMNDMGWGMTRAADQTIWVVGETYSFNFPTTPDAFDESYGGLSDGFLAHFSANGSSLLYSTFLGSTLRDVCRDVVLDSEGNIYIVGVTSSEDFPVTPNAADTTHNGWNDAFLIKLDPTGRQLLYGTYLGGSLNDKGRGIVLLDDDRVCITGFTESTDFPVTEDAFDWTCDGEWDVFVTVLDLASGETTYSTYLGGVDQEEAWDLGVDAAGDVYVTGYTKSPDFPSTLDAFDPGWNGQCDAFLTKIDLSGGGLVYSTFIGGGQVGIALGDFSLLTPAKCSSPA
jgi:hypothetical protein